jgi:hypothetical protein
LNTALVSLVGGGAAAAAAAAAAVMNRERTRRSAHSFGNFADKEGAGAFRAVGRALPHQEVQMQTVQQNDPTGVRNGETFVQERYASLVKSHFFVVIMGIVGIVLLAVDILLQRVLLKDDSELCCNTVLLIFPFIANALPLTAAMSGNIRSAWLSAVALFIALPFSIYVAWVDRMRFGEAVTLSLDWLLVATHLFTLVFILLLVDAIRAFNNRTHRGDVHYKRVQSMSNLVTAAWVVNQLVLIARLVLEVFIKPDDVSLYRNTILLVLPFAALFVTFAFARTGAWRSTIFGLVLVSLGFPLAFYSALDDTRRFDSIIYLMFEWTFVAIVFLTFVAVLRFFLALMKYRKALKIRKWKTVSLQT